MFAALSGRRLFAGTQDTSTMRRRITRLVVAGVVVALVVFAVPLAVAAHQLLTAREFGELQRAALTTATRVDASAIGTGDPVESPRSAGITVAVLATGSSGAARAAAVDRFVARGLDGGPGQGRVGAELVAVVPVSSGETVRGVVRASSPVGRTWRLTMAVWAVIAAAGAVAAAVAWLLSRARVHRLVQPVEQLAADVNSLGRLGSRPAPPGRASGLPEVDTVVDALAVTAHRLEEVLRRQRSFATHASHQLRTPLTGLELVLESAIGSGEATARAAIEEALAVARRLETTVDDVLHFSRQPTGRDGPLEASSAGESVGGVEQRWRGQLARLGRRLEVGTVDPDHAIAIGPSSMRQVLDVLVGNAVRHGSGTVRVDVRELGEHLAIDVTDQGRVDAAAVRATLTGTGTRAGAGLGLPLAAAMLDAEGGRLVFSSTSPTRFTVLVPLR